MIAFLMAICAILLIFGIGFVTVWDFLFHQLRTDEIIRLLRTNGYLELSESLALVTKNNKHRSPGTGVKGRGKEFERVWKEFKELDLINNEKRLKILQKRYKIIRIFVWAVLTITLFMVVTGLLFFISISK